MPETAHPFRRPARREDLLAWWVASLQAAPRDSLKYALGILSVSVAQAGFAWAAAALVGALASSRPADSLVPAVVGALAALSKVGASGWVASSEISVSRRLGEELRDNVLTGLLAGQRRQGAEDVFRILGAIRAIEQAALVGGLGGVRALVALVPLVILVLALVPGLFLLGLLALVPFAMGLAWARRALLRDEQQALELTASLEHQTDALFRFTDLWRVAGSAPRARSWVRVLGERARGALASARARRAMLSASNEALAALGVLGLVWAFSSGRLTLDAKALASFSALALLAYRPLRDWGDARGAWQAGGLALDTLLPWLDTPDLEVVPEPPLWELASLQAEHFGAAWHTSRWSFVVPPGSLVVLVGPNGGGKTTLLRTLLGLEPSVGSLTYGGRALEKRLVGPSGRPFAWCPQEAPLFSASLEENLTLGGAGSDAGLLSGPLWTTLQGLTLGEGGRALSGGERTWVNLARTFGSSLPVLLLDEPTASLDAEAEARVVAAVESLRGRRTVLVVTHRPGLWNADRVLEVPPRPQPPASLSPALVQSCSPP